MYYSPDCFSFGELKICYKKVLRVLLEASLGKGVVGKKPEPGIYSGMCVIMEPR